MMKMILKIFTVLLFLVATCVKCIRQSAASVSSCFNWRLKLNLFKIGFSAYVLIFSVSVLEATPLKIGEGDFILKPDTTTIYKTVDSPLGPVELKIHGFLPKGYKASDKRPAIVFFHGGGWYGGTPDHFYPQSRYFALRGMVCFSAQYRLINANKTSPRECVVDGKSAIRWVRQHASELGVDPTRILAGGGSAGGHVAAATALCKGFNDVGGDLNISPRPEALILFNPVFDNGPKGFAHSLVKDYWKEISPIDNIDGNAPPTIVILGTKDKFIPVATAERYKRIMEEAGVRCYLHLYQDKLHGFYNIWIGKEDMTKTLLEVDAFLSSLGYLEGEPLLSSIHL